MQENLQTAFWEYYHPTGNDVKVLEEESIYVLDACSILSIYCLPQKDRKTLFKKLNKLSQEKRLWLPYQFYAEYLKNRVDVTVKQYETYSRANLEIKKYFEELIKKLIKSSPVSSLPVRHYGIQKQKIIDEVKKYLLKLSKEISRKIDTLKVDHPDYRDQDKDPILKFIEKIYRGRVGENYSSEEMIIINEKVKERTSKGLPPGKTDLGKSINSDGDKLAWMQILDYAQIKKSHITFVTEETKKDWYEKWVNDGELRPSRFLTREIHDRSGKLFNICNIDTLMGMQTEPTHSPSNAIETIIGSEVVGTSVVGLDITEAITNSNRKTPLTV